MNSHQKIEAALIKKKEKLSVKITTHLQETRITSSIHGLNKNFFFEDCIKRNWRESKMLKHIIDVYYSIMSNRPDIQGKEMTEIKNFINDRIKFK